MNTTAPEPRIRPGTTVAGRVESIAGDGRGVLSVGGREVLVRGAWPGDVVEARIYRRRRGKLEAYALAVEEEGISRRQPPCVHVGECGGCVWQQWPISAQREMKRCLVEQALKSAMPDMPVEVLPTREVGPEFGYRNKMEFAFGRNPDGKATLGLHRLRRFDVTFDLVRCWIASPRASEAVAWVREWANRHGLAAYDGRTHEGILRYLVVRESAATGEIMANLVVADKAFEGLDDLADGLPHSLPQVVSLLLSVNARKGDTAIPEFTEVLAGQPSITERIGPLAVELSARSFLQTNTGGAAVLYEMVRERAALAGSERVLDLYCGAGLIGLWLAGPAHTPPAREVVGVEQVPEAVADAERLRDRLGYEHVRFVRGDAERVLPAWAAEGESFDVAVVDPPRAGLHPKARAALVALRPGRIVYVSCNPSSLAKDMNELIRAGYAPGPVEPVDMFPQTAHVESLVRLDRRGQEP